MKLVLVSNVLMYRDCKYMEIRDLLNSVENVNMKIRSLIIIMVCVYMVEWYVWRYGLCI